MVGYGGNDTIDGEAGDDLLDGGWGRDTLRGGIGKDILDGGFDDDVLDGGQDGDTYLVSGNQAAGWSSFNGFDTYTDSGTDGVDRILATGSGPVDIGFASFSSASGIEQIVNGTTNASLVRLLGDWKANTLDFSTVSLIGSNFLIDGGDGADTVTGSSIADRINGGRGVDRISGNAGADVITGGLEMDVLSGGADNDTFTYTNLQDGLWGGGSTFERITDFVVGSDRFDVNIVPASIQTLGAATALNSSAIGKVLSNTVFVANGAATFTFTAGGTTRTFIALNDSTAGFQLGTDALLEITGYSYAAGMSSLSQISLV